MPKKSEAELRTLEVFSQRLSDLMLDREITNKQLAKDIGISEAALSGYSSYCANCGKIPKSPQYSTSLKIAKALGVTLDYLFGATNEPDPNPSAVDDLRLSPDAVRRIKNLNRDCPVYNYEEKFEDGEYTDVVAVLDFFLTSKYFHSFIIAVAQSIYNEKKAPADTSLVIYDCPPISEGVRTLDNNKVLAATQSLLAWENLRRIIREAAEKETNHHGRA